MAQQVTVRLDLNISVDEVSDLVTASLTPANTHRFPFAAAMPITYSTGTGDNQQDKAWSARVTFSGAIGYDLSGSLLSKVDGAPVVFANIRGFAVINNSTTTGQTLTIGGGSNPWITWLSATGDAVVIGPGGIHVWTSPMDGASVTAATGDILTITSSASLSHELVIWGQVA